MSFVCFTRDSPRWILCERRYHFLDDICRPHRSVTVFARIYLNGDGMRNGTMMRDEYDTLSTQEHIRCLIKNQINLSWIPLDQIQIYIVLNILERIWVLVMDVICSFIVPRQSWMDLTCETASYFRYFFLYTAHFCPLETENFFTEKFLKDNYFICSCSC